MYSKPNSFLITHTSPFSVNDTADKIERMLHDKHVTLFGRIDHSQAAADVGLEMKPEILLIFGSPKVGTPLMVERPEMGIELPLKILIWEYNGKTHIGYHDLTQQLQNYHIEQNQTIINQMQTFMELLVGNALEEGSK